MSEKKLREILENYFYAYAGGRNEKTITRAILQIKQLIKVRMGKKKTQEEMLKCLPKESDSIDTLMQRMKMIAKIEGYNKCHDEFTKLIDEV